jgi:hypothetical protein
MIKVYRPDGHLARPEAGRAPSPESLRGARVVVLDNGKPNAAPLMARLAELLAERAGVTFVGVRKKGPGGRSANAAIPCDADVFEGACRDADLVITGTADCGSCTAYSVYDTVEFERRGIPTVLVTTTRFDPIARTVAEGIGMVDVRRLVVEHPIGGIDAAALDERAAASVAPLTELFVGAPVPPPRAAPVPVALLELLDQARALVRDDGADLELVDYREGDRALRLRLVIQNSDSIACVMPAAILGRALRPIFKQFGDIEVSIDDPRRR